MLIDGASGSGKSSLALALIDRGACLIGDDSLLLEEAGGRLLARPHPETRGMFEIRNLGIVTQPVCDSAPAALLIRLDPDAPRYIETAESWTHQGVAIPLIRLWPGAPVLALRAERALALYGLVP